MGGRRCGGDESHPALHDRRVGQVDLAVAVEVAGGPGRGVQFAEVPRHDRGVGAVDAVIEIRVAVLREQDGPHEMVEIGHVDRGVAVDVERKRTPRPFLMSVEVTGY